MSRGLGGLQREVTWALLHGGMSLGDLARKVGADRSNVRRAVLGLERRGKVETRKEVGEDGRVRLVVHAPGEERFWGGLAAAFLHPDPNYDYEPSRFEEEEEEEEEDYSDPKVRRRLREEVWRSLAKPLPGDDEPEPEPEPVPDEQALAFLRRALYPEDSDGA